MTDYGNQRVGVFIDVSNLYHSARAIYNANVNFSRILDAAVNGRQLIRALAYVVKSEAAKEQGFFDALTKTGLDVVSKDIQVFGDGTKKGDWDVGISVDAIKIADRLDVVVLVTGDGDFVPLVRYLKENKGCRVEGISFGKSTSARLIEELDSFTDIDGRVNHFVFRPKPSSSHPKPGA